MLMSEPLLFSVFTLFPLFLLAIASGLSTWKVHRSGEYRLLLLVAILLFMLSHQLLEARAYVLTGSVVTGVSEGLETTANTLASVAVYYGATLFERERELKTALEESRHRYRTLTEKSPLPILVSQDGAVVYANEAMTELVGARASEELSARSLRDLFSTDDSQDVAELVTALVEEDTGVSVAEAKLDGGAGQARTVLVSGGQTTYEDEQAVQLVLRDVTRERKTLQELEQTQGRLETTLESSNDAIFLIDPDSEEIIDANSKAASMLKYDQEELIGLSPFTIHPQEISKFERFLDRVFETGGLRTDELSCMRKDGVEIPAEISASTTTAGDQEYVLTAVRDISDRKSKQRQIRVLGRILRHNLRNDMTVVMGQAGVIKSRTSDEAVGNAADRIVRTASELVDLSDRIRTIRTSIRSEASDGSEVALRPVITSVLEEMSDGYPQAEITVEVPRGSTITDADPEHLNRAISNLVENAIEHNEGDEPGVWIAVDRLADRRGDWVAVRVADDGPVIRKADRTAATAPLDQTDLSHSTGLGLWEVGQVVDTLGGDVNFEQRTGGGNVVTLQLRGTVGTDETAE
jgi:PAS domain S-box-containing protein